MARRTKCNPERTAAIASYISKGATFADACTMAGISHASLYNWVLRAEGELERVNGGRGRKVRKSEQVYVDFFEAIKKAEAERKQAHIDNINRHAMTSWQASAWFLERRYPKEFGKRQAIEHAGPGGNELIFRVVYDDEDGVPDSVAAGASAPGGHTKQSGKA